MNIQTLLNEIKQTGMSDREIGAEVGMAQSMVTRLRNGKHRSTSYERGQKIERLHAEKVSETARHQ